jgi:hypothetical protein
MVKRLASGQLQARHALQTLAPTTQMDLSAGLNQNANGQEHRARQTLAMSTLIQHHVGLIKLVPGLITNARWRALP